jgi:amino acid adenylation domain-containing protein
MKIFASSHQERLWFIDKFEAGKLYPASPVYHNLPLILRFHGRLDLEAINESFQRLINRHEIARTTLNSFDDNLYQCVAVSRMANLDVLTSLAGLSDAEAMDLLREYIKTPFFLEKSLLIRCGILQLSDAEYMVAIVAHHVIADRSSMRLLARELWQIYYSLQHSQEWTQLPAISFHYSDFSLWQNNLPEELLDEQWLFWKTKLKGKLQEIDLPGCLPRPKIHVYDDASIKFNLPDDCVAALKSASKNLNANHQSLLLAAFKVLLQKYTGNEEVVIGTLNNYRHLPGTEQVVGPLANLVTLRSFIKGEDRFSDVVRMLVNALQEVADNGALPFERLVTRLRTTNDMGRTALFDVLFHYEKNLGNESIQAGLPIEIETLETNLGLGKYDINLLITETDSLISCVLVFNGKYYGRNMVERLVEHYQHLLYKLLGQCDLPIRKHTLITEKERLQLNEWNDTNTNFPHSHRIIDLFEKQVFNNPNRVAVVQEKACLTYTNLSKKASQIAFVLRQSYQVNNNAFVGVMLDNSPLMIACVLGILKAGGAYVPIDPAYPAERVNYMLNDSACKVVITSPGYLDKLDLFNGQVCEAAWLATGEETDSLEVDQTHNTCEDIAYLIYTSGTTGLPKGCQVTNKNVVRLISNDAFPFDITDKDVWVMAHSLCFDFSVWEIFGALLRGGKLVIPARDTVRDTNKFYALIKAHCVTVLNQTPAAFYQFIETARQDDPKELHQHLRYVIFGGDKLEMWYLRHWIGMYPLSAIRLVNMYGITETTVHVSHYQIKEADITAETTVSCIGRPLPETQVYVLDEDLNPSPFGVPGEMYIGGTGVSAGYWNKPELTAKRFVSNPFNEKEKLYRSGDLARWNANGTIEYIGRIDSQVKIRGYRIELGEIEKTLLRLDEIREARVLLQERNDRSLVAYLVSNQKINAGSIRNSLLQTLPDYMVPTHFVQLDKIPLNANGKIDTGKLPDIQSTAISEIAVAQNLAEEMLCTIFSEVLDVDHIGTNNSFFELGGHSLKAMKLISRIYEVFKVKLDLSCVFVYPSVKSLAQHIDGLTTEVYQEFPQIEQQEFYMSSHAQQRLWLIHQMDESRTSLNMTAGYRLVGQVDVDAFTAAFRAVIQRHEVLRTTFLIIDNMLVQKVHPQAIGPSLVFHDLRNNTSIEQSIAEWELTISTTEFELDHGPLLQACLLRVADEAYILLFNIHHIIADGWSLEIVKKELFNLYLSNLRGTGNNLEPLSFQYKEYAKWQRDMVKRWEMARQYWHNYLSGDISPLQLTTDFARPEVPTFRGKRLNVAIEKATAEGLSKLCASHDVTLFMLLLALVKILLHRYTGQKEILVGFPVSGRDLKSLESQVGLYLNTLVIRTPFDGNATLSSVLVQVKHSMLGAYKYQLYPFDLIVEELIPERDNTRHSPFFDVVVQLQHEDKEQPGGDPLEGIRISDLAMDNSNSKNELTFFFSQTREDLGLCIEYNSDLYKESTIQRMRDNFQHILSRVTTMENVFISDDELLLKEDREEYGVFGSSSTTF